jgi:NitT/TauT family transport system substrate-binding protein
MRKPVFIAAALLVLASGIARAQDKMVLQLKWLTQAQFAGYYVAKDKGFYRQVGLDVTVKPGGPDIDPSQVIAGGGADVIVDWMPSALARREKGVPLVNIAQIFQRSGMMLTCRRESGITAPENLRGRTLGVWFAGNEYPFLAWMDKLGYGTAGGRDGVTVIRQGFNVNLLLRKQADCISTMTYNEYWMLIKAGIKPKELVTFKYEDEGVATLEDGLYALGPAIAEARTSDRLARFVKATLTGWSYAIAHQDEAVAIVLANDATHGRTKDHQTRMMGEVAKLVAGGKMGYLDPAAYQRTVDELLAGKSDPVISKPPEGAWTHAIWEAAQR